MSRLTDLIAQAKAKDPQLGADLEAEFRVLSERRPFGLNFERHQPEAVELPSRPIRKGDKVRILLPRGTTGKGDPTLWRVTGFDGNGEARTARLAPLDPQGPDSNTERVEAVTDLVVVAEFRDPIYPGLVSTGRVERGGPDKPFHTVINAENYHALQPLLCTHRGKVDCIYIDPPYNTGAKDWKYNNDYVDGDDLYRHSKWLAFMERRLLLARELLNSDASVLIIAIDEREVHRLGLLLTQVFPDARMQMVSTLINPKGSSRAGQFGRSDEYLFFVQLGTSAPSARPLGPEWQGARATTTTSLRWVSMIRSGTGVTRRDRPGMFYPIFLNGEDGSLMDVGTPLPLGSAREEVPVPDGAVAVWPLRADGSEGRWQIGPETARNLRQSGFLRVGRFDGEAAAISYLKSGEQEKVRSGIYGEVTVSADGHIEVAGRASVAANRIPTTQWSLASHSASEHGTRLLRQILPGRSFPFPKSLYAVEDALRFFIAEKPRAIVLDFFAGSGTTAHAVMRLNHQDGGERRCISVTNNEVSADEQEALSRSRLRPGDPDWEVLGICDHVTKPRIRAAVTGQTPQGEPITGEYKFTDEFPMSQGLDENVEFFTLTYETPWRVARHRAFDAVAPLLWLRAGAQGRRIDSVPDKGWDVADVYGILVNLDRAKAFAREVASSDSIRVAFVVTDDDRRFQMVCGELPDTVEVVRLYESYLRNFEINTGRE